jgi:phosphoribosyl 1,2-cyclic phosphate phosphodiesterase
VRVEILGSGGAVTTPRPGCLCCVCAEARERGIPYSRTGPSIFVHGPDLLFDTPEESKEQLNRSRIGRIAACFYSHWHPDHVMGRRVWETRNHDFRGWPPEAKRSETTDVYLPAQVAADFRVRLAGWEHLSFLEEQGSVRVHVLADGDEVELGGTRVRPFPLAEEYVYAFLLDDGRNRVLLAMDELNGWTPPPELGPLDLAVVPIGVFEHHPLTGERLLHPEHPILRLEATFAETVEIVRALDARRVVLSHVEEMGVGHDVLVRVAERLRVEQGLPVEIAHDTLVAALGES